MSINLESTTDSKEVVAQALGDLAPAKIVDQKPEVKTEDVEVKPATDEVAKDETTQTDDASDDETETQDEEGLELKQDDEKPKKKGGWQRKLEKKDKAISSLELEKAYWREQALRTQQQPNQAVVKTEAQGRPKATDFATHDEYVEALTDWKVDQKDHAREEKQKIEAIKSQHQARLNKHAEKVSAFSEEHDDFDDVIESVNDIPISLTVQESILESDNGPELMYELAKNPKEYKRICSLGPIKAALEIGKIEARLSKTTESSSTPTKTTKSPAPITPVRAKGAAMKKDLSDPSLSQSEYNRLRDEQLRSRVSQTRR